MRKYFFLIVSTGTLVMLVVMAKTGAPLKTATTPYGILDLEFAYNSDKAAAVLDAWKAQRNSDNITAAKINTQLDFIFLLFYAAFLYNACKMVAGIYDGAVANTGLLLAYGSIAAGLLDIFENIGMLLTLHGHYADAIPLATCIFAIVKWLLALAALLYFLIAGGYYLVKKMRR